MAEVFGLNADVYLGEPDQPLPDWRKDKESAREADDEDEDEVQPGVAALLGFDPSELDDEENGENEGGGDVEGGGGDGEPSDDHLSKGFRSLMKSADELWQKGAEYP